MSQIDYPVVVRPLSRENGGGYAAFAEDLPGCIADGETPAEALEELRQAIDEWIAEAVRLGREVPPPGSAAEHAKRDKEAVKNLIAQQSDLIARQSEVIGELNSSLTDIEDLKDRVDAIEAQILKLFGNQYDDEQNSLSTMTITRARTGSLYVY